MPTYIWLLALGGGLTLFAASNGIWNYMVPQKAKNPTVPLSYRWRLLSLTIGVLLLGAGLANFLSAALSS
jgi:hypothetical protein